MPSTIEKPMITMYPTNKCTATCIRCPRERLSQDEQTLELSFNNTMQILEAASRSGYKRAKFSSRWGDPLTYLHIQDLIRYAKDIGYEDISLSTNGALLKDKISLLKDAGLHRVCISFDTLKKGVHYQITQHKDFDVVIEGIELAAELLGNVKINMVVMAGVNDQEIIPMFQWASERNITLQLIELVDRGNKFTSDIPNNQYFYDLDYVISMFSEHANLIAIDKIEKRTTLCLGDGRIEVRQSRKWPNTFATSERLLIHPDGTIGFWYNDKTDERITTDMNNVDEIYNMIEKAKAKSVNFELIKEASMKGHMPTVS